MVVFRAHHKVTVGVSNFVRQCVQCFWNGAWAVSKMGLEHGTCLDQKRVYDFNFVFWENLLKIALAGLGNVFAQAGWVRGRALSCGA